jgi:ATP-binding cassette subfamily A (ABC1) protein 3
MSAQMLQVTWLWAEQIFLMSRKHINQKQRKGRDFLKETIMIPFFILAFMGYLFYNINMVYNTPDVYSLHGLPPLSATATWGIFNPLAKQNNDNFYIEGKNLLFSPSNHAGVNDLINALTTLYPDVTSIPCESPEDVHDQYRTNMFTTWAAIEFNLSDAQLATGLLIPDEDANTVVDYTIFINANDAILPNDQYDDSVYNSEQSGADLWWASGYMTLQNFVSTYLARQYSNVSPTFQVDTFLQRYPKSPVYENTLDWDWSASRWAIWRWMGPVILTIIMFTPMLGLCTETVRERQFKMKDLLEISGLMAPSYWCSYVVTILLCSQVTLWWSELLLYGFGIFDSYRILPYAALITCYTVGMGTFSMAFGFAIPRSEYYGLPAFLLSTGLSVAGLYLANAYNITAGAKLFISFLCPQIGFGVGIFTIEDYLHRYSNSDFPYSYHDPTKNFPSLIAVNAMIVMSGLLYGLIAWGMPFDWIFRAENQVQGFLTQKNDEIEYPCDNEEREAGVDASGADFLLKVNSLSHIYPDGTNAVKNMSFNIKRGEVLSFLGANGAGKSTTMGMLCGTLSATIGDALVNGFSITTSRTQARRNLGICMQQDIIWDDVNIEDHLILFGGLRGLHGKALRDDVDKMIQSLGFPEKRHSMAGTLSGGQKRRLCVGLSMVGGNSVVYLDEPTAGLDPVSRRQLWELVQRNRNGRAILLTTHFMDEADVLGDRIAIVKEGRLRAIGSSSFLKTRFGLGYLLRMSLLEGSNPTTVVDKVKNFVPSATVASSAGTELSVRMSKDSVKEFPALFENLEAENKLLGVVAFGIETTTLEEVFMRIVNEDNETLMLNHDEANKMLGGSFEERQKQQKEIEARDNLRNPILEQQMRDLLSKGRQPGSSQWAVFFPQLRVLLHKRFYQFTRSKGQWSMGFFLPILVAVALGALIQSMPTDVLMDQSDDINVGYVNVFTIPITGSSVVATESYASAAFAVDETTYVGASYTALYDDINDVATTEAGEVSTNGIFYEGYNNITVMYNSSWPLNFPAVVTNVLNAAVTNVTDGKLDVVVHANTLPMNLLGLQSNDALLVSLLLSIFAGSVGAALSIVVGGERVQLVKHQQLASGASKSAYWLANFLFDLVLFYGQIIVLLAILACFMDTFSGPAFGYLALAGIPYAIATILRFYSMSFFVGDIRMAQTVYFYGSLFIMFVDITILFVLVFTTCNDNISNPIAVIISAVLTVIDPTLAFFLFVLFSNNFLAVQTLNPGKDSLQIGSVMLVVLILVDIPLYLFTTAYLDDSLSFLLGFCTTSGGRQVHVSVGDKDNVTLNAVPADEDCEINVSTDIYNAPHVAGAEPAQRMVGGLDPDVQSEKRRVAEIMASHALNPVQNAIFINQLKKIYYGRGTVPTKVAVKDVSISIAHGEVFGLLGANGAGKTTLLKMVSGQEDPSQGRAMINGFDVVRQRGSAQMSMGLCPQFDTLVERLSVRENLLFFGQIKGLTGQALIDSCEAFMAAMGIKRYENKLIMQLSGGNRRKVSLAVALLGSPPTVYLDEPSTGLDPVASRLMWRLLSKIASTKESAVVLTTHNMLECEAVCTRICIMKLGEMVCLGDSQHLRSAHGTGFLLELSLHTPDAVEPAKQFVAQTFPGAVIVDEHATMINFEIPKASISRLSAAFRTMEQNKQRLQIVDYALSQSTLEQVFLKQIRPSNADQQALDDQHRVEKFPTSSDYAMVYAAWLLAIIVPGLHHFYLGNTMRGVKYFLTWNEVFAGWFLDFFELHVLVQKSVEEYGHTTGPCGCCMRTFCCCCTNGEKGRTNDVTVARAI